MFMQKEQVSGRSPCGHLPVVGSTRMSASLCFMVSGLRTLAGGAASAAAGLEAGLAFFAGAFFFARAFLPDFFLAVFAVFAAFFAFFVGIALLPSRNGALRSRAKPLATEGTRDSRRV